MFQFIKDLIENGFLDQLYDGMFDGLLYDNPLLLFYWIFVISFIIYILKRSLFGV